MNEFELSELEAELTEDEINAQCEMMEERREIEAEMMIEWQLERGS